MGVFAGPGSQLPKNILGLLAPRSASELVRNVVRQTFKASSGISWQPEFWVTVGGLRRHERCSRFFERDSPSPRDSLLVETETHDCRSDGCSCRADYHALVLAPYDGKIGQALFANIGGRRCFPHFVESSAMACLICCDVSGLLSGVLFFAPNIEEGK
jgi:hypothetical protein